MSNIIDKIRVSGTDYTLSATSSGGNPTIEVTQAEYDALVSAGTVQEDTYYIITDSSIDYINSAQCQSQIDSSISGKADTSAVTEAINAAVSGKVSTNDFNAYSGATDTLINSKASQSDLNSLSGTVTAHTANTNIHLTSAEKTNIDSLATNIAAISGITATKVGNWDTAYTNNHTHSNKSALDAITGNVGTMAYENVSSYSSATEVNSALGNKLGISEFNTYSGSVNTEIGSKASQSDLNSLSGTVTGHTADTTIHVTSSEKQAWNAKSDFSGSYNDLTDKPTIPTSASQLTNDSGYITSGDAQSQIDSSISEKVDTSTYTAYTSTTATEIGGKASQSDLNSLSGTVTGHTANTTIHVTSSEKTMWSGKADTSAVTEAIDAAVSGKVDTSTYTAYTAATDSRIYGVESEVSSKVDKIYLDNGYEDGVKIEYYGSYGGHYIDDLTLFDVGSGLTMEFSGNTWVLSATGGSGTVSSAITRGDTNAVAGGAVYDKFDEVEQVTAAALNDINDRVSEDEEVTAAALNYLNEHGGGGGNPTVELTQAEYDALVSAGTVSADTYYIITDATPVDMSNYYTTAQTNTLLAGKQDTLSAGRGISISSNTISFDLPISAGTGINSVAEGSNTTASGQYSHAEGYSTTASGYYTHAEGYSTTATSYYSHAEGFSAKANGIASHAEGYYTRTNNISEHASGQYNVSSSASTTFGDSGNTLFSVGNGTANNARHNAFEIRQNGDIYISSGGTDIKLQDHLGGGGGGITIDPSLDSGSTNPVANSAITKVLSNYYYARKISNSPYSSPYGTISSNGCVGFTLSFANIANPNLDISSPLWLSTINGKDIFHVNPSAPNKDYFNLNLVETSAITTAVTSSSTDAQVPSAKAVNDKLGGLSLVKLTQAQYDALATKDNNTLYVIVN